jgi:hypothetical protein
MEKGDIADYCRHGKKMRGGGNVIFLELMTETLHNAVWHSLLAECRIMEKEVRGVYHLPHTAPS